MRKVIYVIGAGASVELGLPSGYQLKRMVSKDLNMRFHKFSPELLSGSPLIVKALRGIVQDINPYLNKAWDIIQALPLAISIDNYIDAHQEDDKIKLLCKLGIVTSILNAEKQSPLFIKHYDPDQELNFSRIENTWYMQFFKLLTENCSTYEDLHNRFEKITLIIFNYDRCVEQFLYFALRTYYKHLNPEKVHRLLSNITVYHPYGSIGDLSFMKQSEKVVEYGGDLKSQKLLDAASRIKTFSEQMNKKQNFLSMRDGIKNAKKLIFLGFAFHKINLTFLGLNSEINDKQGHSFPHIYATGHGISESDQVEIKKRIAIDESYRQKIQIKDLACYHFFHEFKENLSF